jgi:hypothetical protein
MIDVVFWPFATYCDCDWISGELWNLSKRLNNFIASILLFCRQCGCRLPSPKRHTSNLSMGISRDAFSFMPISVKEPPPPLPGRLSLDGHPSSETISASLSGRKKQQNKEIYRPDLHKLSQHQKNHTL